MENRDVATVDIPGASMQADMDEEIVHKTPWKDGRFTCATGTISL